MTYTEKLREEFEKSVTIHIDMKPVLMYEKRATDEISDWWIEKIYQAIAEEREREMFIINFMGMDIVARVPDNFRIDKDQTDRILSSAKETINELINAPFKKRTIDEIRADLEND